MPYIDRPDQHESFVSIFEVPWVERLRSKLKSFLKEMVCFSSEEILLVKAFESYSKMEDKEKKPKENE